MRELLFRGIREDNGEWLISDSILRIDNSRVALWAKQGGWREVLPDTVGQFTGLNDKNGARVFEGDVMEFTAYGEYYKDVVYIYKGNFGIFCKPPSAHCEASPFLDRAIEEYNAIVIGSIHDRCFKSPEQSDSADNWYMKRFQKKE